MSVYRKVICMNVFVDRLESAEVHKNPENFLIEQG